MHHAAWAGQCINPDLYLECGGIWTQSSCQPVDAAAACPFGTFWSIRLLLCKIFNHKNGTPILCINQQLVAVATAAVCLTAGYYAFGCPKEPHVWGTAESPGSTPFVFSLRQSNDYSRHHAQPTQHFPLCWVFKKCALFPINPRVKQVRYTCPRLGWQTYVTLESL